MDAREALAELTAISPDVELAVIADEVGASTAATVDDEERARTAARLVRQLVEEGDQVLAGGGRQLAQAQIDLRERSVFVVREGEHALGAVTGRDATPGLLFYDLRRCLRSLASADEHATR
jgi:predicted regulator of Ras-like GTPase activity (Roadblock/LC7/MglB family)